MGTHQSTPILDIRYYESDHENISGTSLPRELGRLYPFPKSICAVGTRIARKLREYNYTLGTFNHLYINFTTLLTEHQFELANRIPEPWLRYINYGLDPASVLRMTSTEHEPFVADCTFRVLRFLTIGNVVQQELIEQVRRQLEAAGSEIEILHKAKETATCRVAITYQICPHGETSVGWIEYHDKRYHKRGKKRFVELQSYEDIFPLVSNISVSGGNIRLSPRASFTAGLDASRYSVPFVIPISDLLVSD